MSDKKTNRRNFWLMILTVLAFCLIPFCITMVPEENQIAWQLQSDKCSFGYGSVNDSFWVFYPISITCGKYVNATKFLTNEMLELLPKLRHISYADFAYTDLGGLDLNPLTEMSELSCLFFTNCLNFTDELQKLGGCSKLSFLHITGMPVSHKDIQAWKKCPLSTLFLLSDDLANDELEAIAELPSLIELSVESNTGITDEGLEHLLKLKHLQILNLKGTSVTEEGIEDFRKKHPNGATLEITSDF